ncbi:MAG: hypothetical protein U0931_24255 [Vulcanimicrobiota bacterium]
MYVNCAGCGSSNRDHDTSCYNCGQPLKGTSSTSNPPVSSSGRAFFCDPSNEVVVRQGPASLPMHAQSAIGKIPLVGAPMMLISLAIGWNSPFFVASVAMVAFMVLLLALMTWMAKATAANEAILRAQGRVVEGTITEAKRNNGGRNKSPRIELKYTFTGDSGPIKADHWRTIGNFADFTGLKAPEPGTPCYVLYCNDRLYRLL